MLKYSNIMEYLLYRSDELALLYIASYLVKLMDTVEQLDMLNTGVE